MPKSFLDRFEEKLNREGRFSEICGSNCWDWLGYKDQHGYGMITTHRDSTGKQRATAVHSIIWIAFFGGIPDDMVIRHLCSNPACCNPNHLMMGTRKENTQDMIKSGRARGRRSSGNNHVYATKSVMPKKSEIERFWSKVHVLEENECWPWLASKDRDGYGFFGRGGAHRKAYELTKGKIPDGLIILHSCDNPSCVNPSHLRAGTWADNMIDARDRGNKAIKLSIEDIPVIREMYATGNYTMQDIADVYNVSGATIHSIIHRKIWNQV